MELRANARTVPPGAQVLFLMMREMFRFAVVLLVVLLGFSMSFHALFRDADTYGRTCLNLFKAMLGEVGLFDEISESPYENRYKHVATVLLVVYLIIITIVLLNLLIAVLSTSHAKVQEHADQEYRVLKARLIKHYRLVVREDLLPPPFNLVQLPFRWHGGAQRSVGQVIFWLFVGPVAALGGVILWIVSAVLVPFPAGAQFPAWSELRSRNWLLLAASYLLFVLMRVLWFPLSLFGWWLTRPLAYFRLFLPRSCFGLKEEEEGEDSRRPDRVRVANVDEMLKAEREPSVGALYKFLVDPLSDAKVREDERKRDATVEHVKLLRNRLEETFGREVDSLKRSMDVRDAQLDNLHKAIIVMNQKLDGLVESISRREGAESEEGVSSR